MPEESFDPKSQYLVTKKQKENKAFHLYHEYNTINISKWGDIYSSLTFLSINVVLILRLNNIIQKDT